jgi:hypothetical protein
MVFIGAGDILHQLAPVPAVDLGTTFDGRTFEGDGEARIVRHGDGRGLAIARMALHANLFGVHGLVGFEIIESAGSPSQ